MENVRIRAFTASDTEGLVEILQLNGQYSSPNVEGACAMRRFANCEAALFFVAEEKGKLRGFVRAVYDGCRAMVHLLSVHPDCQNKRIGSELLRAVQLELQKRGAPSLSVTATDESAGFWEKQGFHKIPVFLMLKAL